MRRNIVVCCDGTNNEFGLHNTNVVRLYSVLEHSPEQIAYYHPGLGSMGSPYALDGFSRMWTKWFGLAFGYGVSQHLADMYQWLMESYRTDDRLYVFGFSRGAYTARALCAMLHVCGLIRSQNAALLPYAIRLMKNYGKKGNPEIARQFRAAFSAMDVKPHFVGVWDTVSSVGHIYSPLKLPFTAFNPDIATGRHAVSIDERRAFYRSNLWSPAKGQDIQQVWFPGVHSDVGGGYEEENSGLSKITLEWMIGEARKAELRVLPERVEYILGRSTASPHAKPDPAAKLHESLTAAWKALEVFPRFPYHFDTGKRGFHIPLGRRRRIIEGSHVHESAFQRMSAPLEKPYRPKNLGLDRTKYQVVSTAGV